MGKEKKKIAPHGCEPLKLTVTNKTTGYFRTPIFDTLSSNLLTLSSNLLTSSVILKCTFQCIKVDRAVTLTLRLGQKKKHKGLWVQVCCASVKCYPFSDKFLFYGAQINGSWSFRAVCLPEEHQLMHESSHLCSAKITKLDLARN